MVDRASECSLLTRIVGHQRAYEAGIIHRDISEGNVLLVEDESFTGFIGDFDHSFNWKTFLKRRGLEVSRESWEQYARQRYVTNNGPGTRRDEPGDHSSSERRPIKRWAQERTVSAYNFHIIRPLKEEATIGYLVLHCRRSAGRDLST